MSRVLRRYVVLGFSTTHEALDAEALLKASGASVAPVPAPAALSAKCGIALRLSLEDEERAIEALDGARIVPSGRIEIEDL